MEQKKKKILLAVLLSAAGLVLLLAAVAGVVWLCNDFTLTLDVPGEPEVTLEYGAPYTPPVGTAEYRGTLLLKAGKPLEVTAEGSVNTSVVGTYVQTYWAEYRGERAEVTRVVHIVDRKPPEITLRSFDGWYTLPGCPYVEEGVTAYDEYDGDLTKQIQRRDTETEVIYTVTDAAGNTAEARRKIFYNDPFPPELVLLGDGEMTIDQNQTYQEPGYTATDNCDGDLTGQVQVEGLVNPSAPGTYILKYQVTDRYGNTASAERKVTVHRAAPPEPPTITDPDPERGKGKTIYLTFDDGPSGYTPELLQVLEKYGVKATFFVVNTGRADLIAQIAAQGHSIGVHSVSHNYDKIYASEEAFFADFYAMQKLIADKTGILTTIMRFPGGSSNLSSSFNKGIMTRLTKAVTEKGLTYFDWNVSSGDAGGASTATEVFYNVVRGIGSKTVSVVLQHDSKGFSVAAVERIIQWGLANGYTFAALTPDSPTCHHGVNN